MLGKNARIFRWLALSIVAVLLALEATAQARRNRAPQAAASRGGESLEVVMPVFDQVAATVTARTGTVAVSTATAQSGQTQGDLRGVAIATARGMLYQRDAELLLFDEGVPAPSTIGAAWRYDIYVEEFKEFHMRDGSKIMAVDVHLQIADDRNRSVYKQSYFDPPKDDRFTEEQLLRATKDGLDGLAMVEDLLKSLPFGELILMKEREKYLKRLETYKKFEGVNVADYQRQEAAIRTAVNHLMQRAPMPGQGESKRLSYTLKSPRRGSPEFERGTDLFRRGLYQDAIAAWEAIEGDPGDRAYNLGVAHLRRATELLGASRALLPENLPEAMAALQASNEQFGNALKDHRKEMTLLNTPLELLRYIEDTAPGEYLAVAQGGATSVGGAAAIPPPPVITEKFALLIGIGKFTDSRIPSLKATTRDIDLLKSALMASGFPQANIITVVDGQATLAGVRRALDDLSRRAGPNSLVVISISTHGSPPDVSFDTAQEGYLLCHDSTLDSLFATAYPVLDFREHIDRRLRAGQKIVLQDTCYAGYGQQRRRGQHMEFVIWPPYMAVFAACGTNEESHEVAEGGIFTLALASYIKKQSGATTVDELAEHLRQDVPARARSLGKVQTPMAFLGPGAGLVSLK